MKHRILPAAAALVMAAALSACGGSKAPEPVYTDAQEAFSAIREAASEAAQTSAETTAATETAAETEEAADDEKSGLKKYMGHRYNVYIDDEKWEDSMHIFSDAKKYAEDKELAERADEVESYCDMMFSLKDNSRVSFYVISNEIGSKEQVNYDEYEPVLRQEVENDPISTYVRSEKITLDGVDGVLIESLREGNKTMHMSMYIFWSGGRQILMVCTADEAEYEQYVPEFEKILDGVEFMESWRSPR